MKWLTALITLFVIISGCSQESLISVTNTTESNSRATYVEGEKFTDWFNGYATGGFNSNYYSTSSGNWDVINSSGNYKLQETSGSSTAIIYQNSIITDDVTVIAKVKSQAATYDAGIVAKFTDSSNYYTLFLDDGKIKLKKKVNGSWSTLDDASFSFSTSTTYTLKLVIDGSSLKGYVNDTLYLTASDSSLDAGYCGLRTYKNRAIFDAFQIYYTGSTGGGDTTPPGNVTNLDAVAGDGEVTLSWTNPSDADFVSTTITASPSTYTTTLQGEAKTITGLTNGTTYTFTLKTKDESGNYASGKTITATPEATVIPSGNYPTDIIPSLTNWKLTLSVDEDGNDSSGASSVNDRNTNPWEIIQDDLIDFEYDPLFIVDDGGVQFRGHCAGATTSGSKYPRTELRQRYKDSDGYWSVNDYQKLVTTFKVTETPVVKPEISMVQIHGPDDEPLRVQYHKDIGVYIIWNESNKDTANALDYTLGEMLKVTVVVDNGDVTTTIENQSRGTSYSKTWTSSDSTGYFKVGCYTQSSIFLSEFKSNYDEDEPMDAYGEMIVYSIELTEDGVKQ